MNIAEKLAVIAENMQKVYEAGKQAGGGNAALDHTVTFTVDEQPYEVILVKEGNSVNAPHSPPIKGIEKFNYWMSADMPAEFPFTPSDDIEFTAKFSQGKLSMEWETAGLWCTVNGNDYNKVNDGLVVCGKGLSEEYGSGYSTIAMVSDNEAYLLIDPNDTYIHSGSADYNGKTYYYVARGYKNDTASNIIDKATYVGTLSYTKSCVKTILDYYFA